MKKNMIIEAQNSDTQYEKSEKSGILGKLAGVFADYKHGTRNSDRLYSEELWDNRVFNSEDVQEALQTKTLFGELDHPEGDRCETLAKNAAISITKLEKRPEEGVIYGEAEILDTPTGRIVKALADSGAKLGISSRGMGEEIYVDGQNMIDPETYDFITFDVVVTPANTKARVELIESKQIDKLTESLKREINSAENENQLNQIKSVIDTVNLSNKKDLINLIESKANTYKKDVKVENKFDNVNSSIALKVLKKEYSNKKAELENKEKEYNRLLKCTEQLRKENRYLRTLKKDMKSKVDENKKELDSYKDKITENNNRTREIINSKRKQTISDLKEQNNKIEELINKIKVLENKNAETLLRAKQVYTKRNELVENKLNKQLEELNKTNKDLVEENKQYKDKVSKLVESNKSKQQEINDHAKVMLENKKLYEQLEQLKNMQKQDIAKITESKKQETAKVTKLEAQIKKLEDEKAKMLEAQDRFSKLSFDPIGNVKLQAEGYNTEEYSQEDIDLYNALIDRN